MISELEKTFAAENQSPKTVEKILKGRGKLLILENSSNKFLLTFKKVYGLVKSFEF